MVKQTYYGAGDNKMNVDVYGIDMSPNKAYVTMAHADCTPVAVSVYGSDGDGKNRTYMCSVPFIHTIFIYNPSFRLIVVLSSQLE